MRYVRSVYLLALFAMGCSGAEPFLGPASIDGTWAEGFTIAGSGMGMTLTSTGSNISGSGEYVGEAGPSGTVAVTGTINGISVHLDLTFSQQLPRVGPGPIEHFDGQFTSANVLEGSITTDTSGQLSGRISYHRVT
jgi:hypothetical protein